MRQAFLNVRSPGRALGRCTLFTRTIVEVNRLNHDDIVEAEGTLSSERHTHEQSVAHDRCDIAGNARSAVPAKAAASIKQSPQLRGISRRREHAAEGWR